MSPKRRPEATTPPPRPSLSTGFFSVLANTPRLVKLVWNAAPGYLLTSVTVTFLQGLLPVTELYVTKLLVDRIVASLGRPDIEWMAIFSLVGLRFGVNFLFEVTGQLNVYTLQVLKDRFSIYANRVLIEQAVRLDLSHYELPEFHDTLNRAQQSGSDYPVRLLGTLTNLLGQIVSFLSSIALLLSFSPLVMLLLLLTSAPALWVGVRFSGRRFWLSRSQTQAGRRADYLQRVLTQNTFAKEVRLFRLGEYLLSQWTEIRSTFNRQSAHLARRFATVRGFAGTLATLGYYGAYGWTIARTVQGSISIGDLTMYSGAFAQAQSVLEQILQSIAGTYEYNLYVSQYFEFLSLQPQVVDPPEPTPFPRTIQQGLELRNVSFTYPEATKPTLQDLNLTVKPGESIALVGVNGAGKTTLLKLITRLYDVSEGEITLDGIAIDRFSLEDLRQNIGVIFQDFARYSLTAQDNIGFGDLSKRDDRDRIQQATADGGATEVIDSLEYGYDTILGKIFSGGTDLSGGQWQKIGMARAFMSSAPILILDEPTAALDAIAEAELFDRFRRLTAGKMTFFVSHRFSTVRMADRIVVLDNSHIVEVGSHEELMQNDGLYAQMFRLQASSYVEES
ncbi:ABC transporter ATP-binding protein [Baaleninema simplex]|uniref:ABC transporter ATP-binding protein n=1 Tax=Baaleninema simplex TaxID=2862350 RepID=UPI000345D7AB|nr:ABC transporter ATP-binding protein [Baaleninema simplex]